jgi:hypothetical protein
MKYIKTFESARSDFEDDIENWESLKKFFNSNQIKKIDDFIAYIKKEHDDLFDERTKNDRMVYTQHFRSDQNKLKTLLKQAKGNINKKFKVGTKLHISKMYSFVYNTVHGTKKPTNDWCIDLEEFGLGRYVAYSDIEIIEISPSGKMITISFNGRNYTSGNYNYNLRDIRLKLRTSKFKDFYFNLMSSDEYKAVMNGEYLKRINESARYNRNVQIELDEILDKIGSEGFGSLSDGEKDFIKSFKAGKENETYKEFTKKVYQDGMFEFKLDRIEKQGGDRKVLHGVLKINGKKFNGYVTRMDSGMNDPQFNDESGSTLWDHADVDGFEYDLDNFIDNIVSDNE